MNSPLRNLFQALARKAPEVAANVFATRDERSLRPGPTFSRVAKSRGRQLAKFLAESERRCEWVALPKAVGRTVFLAACVELLGPKVEEWVVIGIGTCKSNRSVVREVFARRGGKSSVGIPVSVQAEMRGHLESQNAAEILHVHNHPDGLERLIKNALLGGDPLTSDADRDAHRAHLEVAEDAARKTLSPRSVRFFLIENREIHQYWIPTDASMRVRLEALFFEMLGTQ